MPLVIEKKQRSITFLLTYLWDKIVIFLFVALCILSSLIDLFVFFHHHGTAIFVITLTILPIVFWLCGEQLEDPIHPKLIISLMAIVYFSSSEPI